MGAGRNISDMLQPIDRCPIQPYLGTGLHTLGLLGWLLKQTGPADVWVSTFSTSEAFLSGFYNLRQKGLVQSAYLLADFKAAHKTVLLSDLMRKCFNSVALAMNHSKLLLICNDTYRIAVVTSQNQTYGDRIEATLIANSPAIFDGYMTAFQHIMLKSYSLNELQRTLTQRDNSLGHSADTHSGDIRPFGY